jgi:integrase
MGEFLKIQILETKTKVPREFTITPGNVSGLNLLEVFRRYSSLRSKNTRHQRFFVGYSYRLRKCIADPVGINTIGGAPKQMKNPEEYTGHAFRRSSATLLAESGADTSILKGLGGWKSTNVAEGYVDASIQNKKKIAQMILGKDNTTSCHYFFFYRLVFTTLSLFFLSFGFCNIKKSMAGNGPFFF